MSTLRDRLAGVARAGLNAVQDRVADFERDGGLDGLSERLSDRARREEERFSAGRHVLNPEYHGTLKRWYARLEIEPGASVDEVRDAFRDLMRRYHPDRFSGDADREALATRLSQELTVAYEGLLEHLGAR